MKNILSLFLTFLIVIFSFTGCKETPDRDAESSNTHSENLEIKTSDYEIYALLYWTFLGSFPLEENDTVPVDCLIPFLCGAEIFGYGANWGIKEEYKQYAVSWDSVVMPKEKVKSILERIFCVNVDDSVSEYLSNDGTSYILESIVRGHINVKCTEIDKTDETIVFECLGGYTEGPPDFQTVWTESFTLGLKITDENEVQYLYCRKHEN